MTEQKLTQLSLLDGVPNRAGGFKHTKQTRLARIIYIHSIVRAGNADYARNIGDLEKWKKGAAVKHYTHFLKDGVFTPVVVAKSMVGFLNTWENKRRYFQEEIDLLWAENHPK